MPKNPNLIEWLWKLQRAGASRAFGTGVGIQTVTTTRDEAIYCRKRDGRDGTDARDSVTTRIRSVHDVVRG